MSRLSLTHRLRFDLIWFVSAIIATMLGAWLAFLPTRTLPLSLNDTRLLPRSGFNAIEHFPDVRSTYSWTTGRAMLTVPSIGVSTGLRIILAGGPQRRVSVQFTIADTHAVFVVEPERRRYLLLLPRQDSPQTQIQITSSTTNESNSNRVLGILVGNYQISSSGVPSTRILVLLALATTLLYTTTRLINWQPLKIMSLIGIFQATALVWLTSIGWQYTSLTPVILAGSSVISAGLLGACIGQNFNRHYTNKDVQTVHSNAWASRADLIAISLLFLAALAYLIPYIFSGKTIIAYDLLGLMAPWRTSGSGQPQNLLMPDIIRLQVPWRTLHRDAILSGEFPFWNPYVFSGMPFMANHQSGVFYPFNYLFLLFPVTTGFIIFIVLHLFLTGSGLYLLLRRYACRPEAALAGGLTWMFCGFLSVWLPWLSIMATPIWLPWSIFAAEYVITKANRRACGGLALATALTLLAGHTQFAYYSLLTIGIFAVWRVLTLKMSFKTRMLRLVAFGGSCLLGLMISAVQIVPTLELAGFNTRSPVPIRDLINGAIPLRHLPTLLIPDLFGNVNAYTGAGNFVEFTGYIGLIASVFAIVSLLHPQLDRRSPLWFFAGIALFGLHLAYGGWLNVPLGLLPVYTSFRGLQRFYMIWSFGAAGMVAWGLEAVLLAYGQRLRLLGGVAATLISGGMLLWWIAVSTRNDLQALGAVLPPINAHAWIPDPLVLAAILSIGAGISLSVLLRYRRTKRRWDRALFYLPALLIAIDLIQFGQSYLPLVDPSKAFPQTPGIVYLTHHRGEGRILRFGEGILFSPLTPNATIVYGLEDIDGSDSFTIKRYNRLIGQLEMDRYRMVGEINSLGNFQKPASLAAPVLDLLGARFLLTEQPLKANIKQQAIGWTQAYGGADMTIYRNTQALPLGFFVARTETIPNEQAQLATLAESAFKPAQQAILEAAPPVPLDINASGTATLIRRTLNTLTFDVDAQAGVSQNALMIVRQNFYPGWEAWIDGRAVPIVRADYTLQAIAVPSGKHRVELRFTPTYFWWLLGVAVMSLLAACALLMWPPRHHQKRLPPILPRPRLSGKIARPNERE